MPFHSYISNALRYIAAAFLFSICSIPSSAAPFRLLAIGDSLTEEYRFELPFSAPASNPTQQNVKNWVELLNDHRPAAFTMGNYSGSPFSYFDYRDGGYELNYGIPGFKASDWVRVLFNPSFLDSFTIDELDNDLSSLSLNAVIIFVGGNDLSLANSDLQNDQIRQSIASIHDYVRSRASSKPIIVATLPDIGATPKEKLSDPTEAAAARQRVATLNANIIALGSRPNTYIARIDNITDRVFDQIPFHLNGTEFIFTPDPENPPLALFCRDGFHPANVTQALIANEILKAINQFATTPIPLFTNREILTTILQQNPDQPFIDYIGSAGGFLDNPDNDSLPNLIEFLLETDPTSPNSAFAFLPDGTATFTVSPDAFRFADLSVLQSSTLTDDWIAVPQNNLIPQIDGSINILPTAPKLFYKFLATPKP